MDPATDQLHVSLVQRASSLDAEENRDSLAVVADVTGDLVVFPEAFSRDFGDPGTDLAPYAETLDGPFATRVGELAREHGRTVVAGMFEQAEDPERPHNTLVVATPEGRRAYRKIHLYDSFGNRESDQISAGPIEPTVVDIAGFRVGMMTCYDLRFPELARLLVDAGAEVLVLPAAWVAGRRKVDHWRTLVTARAIENTVYVVAAAQPGPRYAGHSMVVSPYGDVLVEAGEGEEIIEAVLYRDELTKARQQNPSLTNRRL